MTERNPYVVLGLPFGASGDDAAVAFAERARGLRRAPDGAERLRALTWALSQVQETAKDPARDLTVYRVPAVPEALDVDAVGVLRPRPHRLRRSTDADGAALAGLLQEAGREALSALRQDIARRVGLPAR